MTASISLENNIQQRWARYRQRFAPKVVSLTDLPAPDLGLAVVIPCYSEPDVIKTINALYGCIRPACAVEILLIINASSADDDAIHRQNGKTLDELSAWATQHNEAGFCLHCVYEKDLPVKHQGVGLARKIGLDLAVSRFAGVGQENGVCISLDADCLVEQNYFVAIAEYFAVNKEDQVAVIDFKHQLEALSDSGHYQAMVAYELYLRYYVQGVRYSGLPYDYQTLGSCFAVRANSYMAQGGMNKRQAGEDFYFIHKFTALSQCGRIKSTRVMPSARLSQRVPFGTGPAVLQRMGASAEAYDTYDPQVFRDLRCLLEWLRGLNEESELNISGVQSLPQPLYVFLLQQGIAQRMAEIRNNTASMESLVERFSQWFNAFLVLKYVHFAHEHSYERKPLIQACQEMLAMSGGEKQVNDELFDLLCHYRQCEVGKA